MKAEITKRLTAAQEILVAAYTLDGNSLDTFTEWDLTVVTWKRNQIKFGCRGYENLYPDHKRVMMEIMATSKKDSPIRRGWIVKIRPNVYCLTNVGKTEALRITNSGSGVGNNWRSPQTIYDSILPLYNSPAFRRHQNDIDEPRLWLGAASFYQLSSSDSQHLIDRMRFVETALNDAAVWFEENLATVIHRGVSGSGKGIHRDDIMRLQAFDSLLRIRFSAQIDAVKNRLR